MAEKIIISFDDEKPVKSEEKIIIDLKATPKEKPEAKIIDSRVSSFFRGNPHLTGFEGSELKYPEGLENGFRKIFSIKLNDIFLNSILPNNKFLVLASTTGKIYFIDRFGGGIFAKISTADESYEKTGIIMENDIYVNSIKSLFSFEFNGGGVKEKKLYGAPDDFYIWSNLNRRGNGIFFLEHSPSGKSACLVSYEKSNSCEIKKREVFSVKHFLYDSMTVHNDLIFIFYDDKILKYNLENGGKAEYNLNFTINSDSNFILLNGKIYFNNGNNELFYFDIMNEEIRFTGIRCQYMNSLAGFGDNFLIGTLSGWHLYKTAGVLLFSYEDTSGNKIESLNKNILAVSSGNKIIFHNLNKFHEAEGFTLTHGQMDSDTDRVISARVAEDMIFVLSRSGILEAYNNDKLNLFI